MNKLRIYACSGIGAVADDYNYWLDNTETVSNTQTVNGLLAKINLAYTEAMYLQLREEEVAERLDLIDRYSVCLYFAQKYADNSEALAIAGRVVGSMLEAGDFISNSLDNEERDRNLDALIAKADGLMENDAIAAGSEFMAWWRENVLDKNVVGLSDEQQQAVRETLQKGSVNGWEDDADLSQYLNEAGTYFLYTYFTTSMLKKVPYVFARKSKTQNATYEYCKAAFVGVYGSEADLKAIIRAGIVREFGDSPENVCNNICAGFTELKSVGVDPALITAIATLITAISSLIMGIIGLVLNAVVQVKAAEISQVDIAAAQGATPNESDYPDDWKKKLKGADDSGMLWIGLAAVAAIFLLGRK